MKKILLKIAYVLITVFIIFIPPVVAIRILIYLMHVEYNLWYKCGAATESVSSFCREQWDFWLADAIDNKYLQLVIIIIFYLVTVATVSFITARILFKTKKRILYFTIITSVLSTGLFLGLILLSIAINNA